MDEQLLVKIGTSVIPFIVIVAATLLSQRKSHAKFVKISELWIYPIKSCKGIKVEQAEVTSRGFELDRIFMIADSSGKFMSQRSHPSMALIDVRIAMENGVSVLKVTAPGMETLTVPTEYPADDTTLPQLTVTVWGDECQAIEVLGAKGSDWFCRFLQVSGARFVRMKDDFVRKTDATYAPNGQSSFADGFPFLLASTSSLQYANERLAEPVTQARFRPNIIVEGAAPFAEDTWEKIRFHDVFRSTSVITTATSVGSPAGVTTMDMSVVKPCARCTIPNIDPETAVPHPQREPSRSMMGFRSGTAIGLANEKWGKQLFYGQNLDHEGQSGATISAGTTVEVLAAGAPFMVKR